MIPEAAYIYDSVGDDRRTWSKVAGSAAARKTRASSSHNDTRLTSSLHLGFRCGEKRPLALAVADTIAEGQFAQPLAEAANDLLVRGLCDQSVPGLFAGCGLRRVEAAATKTRNRTTRGFSHLDHRNHNLCGGFVCSPPSQTIEVGLNPPVRAVVATLDLLRQVSPHHGARVGEARASQHRRIHHYPTV